ncbi:flagellar biosynthesis anti-sigma factor FlgM [Shewanella sp. A25]|nr:flagellar biosynthesis anti-sigma factor FlgM [Shewanella shenzhenensis]
MKINNQSVSPIQLRKSDDEKSPAAPETATTKTAPVQETAQLSSLSLSANDAFEQLSAQDEVDMDKVRAMRSAIANGELSLDEDVLVSAIMDMHRL